MIAKRFITINPKLVVVYVTSVAMLGVFAEFIIGNLYTAVIEKPLWQYTVMPVHDAYTSQFAPILWGVYGFQIYLIHDTLHRAKITKYVLLAAIICIEAIVFEAAINVSYYFATGDYLYYYLPSDLWHFTSVQTLPFYLLAGFVITETIKFFKARPYLSSTINILLILLLVIILG